MNPMERENRRQWLLRLMSRFELTHRSLAQLMRNTTQRAVGFWATGDRPILDWAMLRLSRVETALSTQAGSRSGPGGANCTWVASGKSHLETLDHLDICPHHAWVAIKAVREPSG